VQHPGYLPPLIAHQYFSRDIELKDQGVPILLELFPELIGLHDMRGAVCAQPVAVTALLPAQSREMVFNRDLLHSTNPGIADPKREGMLNQRIYSVSFCHYVFSGEMPEKRYQRGKWMSSQGKKQDLTPNELHDTTFK